MTGLESVECIKCGVKTDFPVGNAVKRFVCDKCQLAYEKQEGE